MDGFNISLQWVLNPLHLMYIYNANVPVCTKYIKSEYTATYFNKQTSKTVIVLTNFEKGF